MKNIRQRAILVSLIPVLMTSAASISLTGCAAYYDRPSPVYQRSVYTPYDYYYYPSVQIYFNVATGYYYYRDGAIWLRTRILPSRYLLDSRDRVRVVIKSDKPYLWNEQHRATYQKNPAYKVDRARDLQERNYHGNQHTNSRRR